MDDRPRSDSDAGEARRLCSRGLALAGEGLLEEAMATYVRSLELDPANDSTWFNLGLVHKWRKRWHDALQCNRRAAELNPENREAWWNLGIAATAMHDWPTARKAWRGFGVDIPEGEDPIEGDYGWTLVRLNPENGAEVVWCQRIDPARAIIRSIPLPGSGHRWGDHVLHDGEPKGERIVDGRRFVVFDELARWAASATPTIRASVHAETIGDVEDLLAAFEAAEVVAEDWTGSVRRLCRACSEGALPCDRHQPKDGWIAEREFGIAAPPLTVQLVLDRWVELAVNRRFDSIDVVT